MTLKCKKTLSVFFLAKTELRLEEELDKDAVRHQFCSTCTVNTLAGKLLQGLET